MAITIQSELVSAIQNWRSRTDLTSARCAEFIALAEAKINREARDLAQETKTTSFSINAEYVNVPSGFLAVRSFQTSSGGNRYSLRLLTDEQQTNGYPSGTGVPKFFSVVGTQFRFAPVPDATYTATLVYYAILTALGTTGTNTNWLLTSHPDIYLYASLFESAAYEQDAEAAAAYEMMFRKELSSLRSYSRNNRYGGPGLAISPG